MADTLSPQARSENMAKIRSRNTGPEILVRRAAHKLGLRFHLHRKDLPGTPDLVFPGRRVAVLVHGCFWHRHSGCRLAYVPKSRIDFWELKLAGNVERDARKIRQLAEEGWYPTVIWECETRDPVRLRQIIRERVMRMPVQPPDR
jgi:DNA mismatch endonuclease (patch repair protein)